MLSRVFVSLQTESKIILILILCLTYYFILVILTYMRGKQRKQEIVMKLSKEQMIEFLESVIATIKADDSSQGTIDYKKVAPNSFEVVANYSIRDTKRILY